MSGVEIELTKYEKPEISLYHVKEDKLFIFEDIHERFIGFITGDFLITLAKISDGDKSQYYYAEPLDNATAKFVEYFNGEITIKQKLESWNDVQC